LCKISRAYGFRWWCPKCDFDLCESCDKPSNTLFTSLHAHPLALVDFKHSPNSLGYCTGFHCDSCGHKNRSPKRWWCSSCNYDLCLVCASEVSPTQLKTLSVLHQHELAKVPACYSKGSYSGGYYCNSCLLHSSVGSRWWCSTCNWDLCPNCVIPENLCRVRSHDHVLVHVDARYSHTGNYNRGFICNICRKSSPTSKRWWCHSCSFDLCDNCIPSQMLTGSTQIPNPIMSSVPTTTAPVVLTTSPTPVEPAPSPEKTCIICMDQPINATIVHGTTAHVCACLNCAQLIYNLGKPCPMCRQKIDLVVTAFFS